MIGRPNEGPICSLHWVACLVCTLMGGLLHLVHKGLRYGQPHVEFCGCTSYASTANSRQRRHCVFWQSTCVVCPLSVNTCFLWCDISVRGGGISLTTIQVNSWVGVQWVPAKGWWHLAAGELRQVWFVCGWQVKLWSPCYRRAISEHFRRATRLVAGMQDLQYDERLKWLGLMRLERRQVI